MAPDKFTGPLTKYLNKELSEYNQQFLIISSANMEYYREYNNVSFLKNPHYKYFFHNAVLTFQLFKRSKLIISHGLNILYFFWLFSFVIDKMVWAIYGGADLGDELSNKKGKNLFIWLKWEVVKNFDGHLTHIKGESDFANSLFKTKAIFFYNPLYLSNVIDDEYFTNVADEDEQVNILVGNSTEPSNNHIELLDLLFKYKNENIKLYCPLSYGPYTTYRDEVIKYGISLFGDKFVPVTEFMEIVEYKKFLSRMNKAVFNHKIQGAMGVILSLLALGKEVYLNEFTTPYVDLKSRDFVIYDMGLVKKGELLSKRSNFEKNRNLLLKYYGKEVLRSSYESLYNYKFS